MASLACLASAAALAATLASQPAPVPLASAGEGDSLEIAGELEPWAVPEDGWAPIQERLWATTYRLAVDGVEGVVLLTGMEPGWENKAIAARAVVLLAASHPDAGQVFVLAPQEELGILG